MSHYIIYHNPNCSKSRQTLEILEEKNVELEVRDYIKTGLTSKELNFILDCLASEAEFVVRTKESLYKENPFDINSREKLCENLILNPILLERPIVIKGNTGTICRPVGKLQKLL